MPARPPPPRAPPRKRAVPNTEGGEPVYRPTLKIASAAATSFALLSLKDVMSDVKVGLECAGDSLKMITEQARCKMSRHPHGGELVSQEVVALAFVTEQRRLMEEEERESEHANSINPAVERIRVERENADRLRSASTQGYGAPSGPSPNVPSNVPSSWMHARPQPRDDGLLPPINPYCAPSPGGLAYQPGVNTPGQVPNIVSASASPYPGLYAAPGQQPIEQMRYSPQLPGNFPNMNRGGYQQPPAYPRFTPQQNPYSAPGAYFNSL